MTEKTPAVRSDWQALDMPERREEFTLTRAFTDEQMAALRNGNIPCEMEDKWFWYMEGDTLYAHRSWTGVCVYRIVFSGDTLLVTVNRDPAQYTCTSVQEDAHRLNELLNWWTQPEYDYYSEWLSEILNGLSND